MAIEHLSQTTIAALKCAFGEADFSYGDLRSLLLAKINREYTASLETDNRPRLQLIKDLDALNSVERLEDKSVPLKIWLDNACDVFASREQVTLFKSALEEMAKGPAVKSDTAVIVEGLEALSVLIKRNQASYEAVVIYRRAFQIALYEIEVITDYKSLHEELHSVQLGWLSPDDLLNLENLSKDPRKQTRVRNLWAMLKRCAEKLRRIYKDGAVDRDENKWIDQFDADRKALNEAIDNKDGKGIEGGLDGIKRELDLKLTKLNLRLKKAIDTLQLGKLITTMNEVLEALRRLATPRAAEQINKLEAGTKELSTLDAELNDLIRQHDDWQKAEDRLTMLREMMGQDADPQATRTAVQEEMRLSTLNFILSVIMGSMLPLVEGRTSEWFGPMKQSAEEMRASLEAKDTNAAESWFDTYGTHASQFFYELDGEMKTRSEELKRIGDELRNVNNELG